MEINVVPGNLAEQQADCIVVNLFEGVTVPGGATGAVDRALDGAIRSLIASGDFTGKLGSTTLLYSDGKLPSPRVLVAGLGELAKFDLQSARKAAASAYRALAKLKGVKSFATIVHGAGLAGLEPESCGAVLAEGTLLAAYQPPNYKREAPEAGPATMTVVEFDPQKLPRFNVGVRRGEAIAHGVITARDLSNEPPNVLFPAEMAARAKVLAARSGLNFTVLNEADMAALNMNILLAVSRGSVHEAQLIILEHAPGTAANEPPLVLVGKGITFDTGGISIKPSDRMEEMKHDMSGAAAVIGAMNALARLKVDRRVIGVAAAVENMPDGNAFRPGDILVGMTGKSTEILSTDAEGRLILADALAYVARFQPKAVVDLATLTGAIGVALGQQAAGLFSNNEELETALLAASKRSGERLWPMPMWEEYVEAIKGDMAEVKNSGGRTGGVSTSAKFIEHFTEGYPWAHLDIANVAWATAERDALTPRGATGFGVRLLVALAENY
ncbi:MAG: leucyl aminopeptidase [Anaerolineales bacterium]|nr:leucyl aminopeptidase [Anaerolineales bacterium]